MSTTYVLVHGAGHTADVWAATRGALARPSVAFDLPGRRDRLGPLAVVRVDDAAQVIADDVDAVTADALVLVGHSVGGMVLPGLAARLGDRVSHLVFVAGITAPSGATAFETIVPGQTQEAAAMLARLQDQHPNHMLQPPAGSGYEPLDVRTAASIDSLNLCAQRTSWAGVPAVPRTFVRCLRDPIQPRDMQAALAANCAAGRIVDIDTGHTPALDDPAGLAAILDEVTSAA
jgi:pimeloyl-ACP methyl ester carboxylesterase